MELVVISRETVGKGLGALRRSGLIPAELYGHGSKNEHLSVPARDFTKAWKEAGSSTIVTLALGKAKTPALIHRVQKNFLTGEVDHVDFYQVRMDEAITATVPLVFTGESKAVKEQQAVVNKAVTEIEVEALPADLPRELTVDLSALDELEKSIYVKDIIVPKGVKILTDSETAVATATPPAKEEEVAPVAEAVPDLSAIKSESEEKVAGRAAAAAEKKEEK